MDHLTPLGWEIVPFYCDHAEEISIACRPSSFIPTRRPISISSSSMRRSRLAKAEFIAACRETDLVFPAIHGAFGEDGEFQALLEKHDIPFVGSPAAACRLMFDKAIANRHLAQHGFATLPNCRVDKTRHARGAATENRRFLQAPSHRKSRGEAVRWRLEPRRRHRHNARRSLRSTHSEIFDQKHGNEGADRALLRRAGIHRRGAGKRQTASRSRWCRPKSTSSAAIFSPSAINICRPAMSNIIARRVFPTRSSATSRKPPKSCSPFSACAILRVSTAGCLKDGRVVFSDFNPISGMEQNSYLFIQGSRIGLTHGDMLRYIVSRAAQRYGIAHQRNPVREGTQIAQKGPRAVRRRHGRAASVADVGHQCLAQTARMRPIMRPNPICLRPITKSGTCLMASRSIIRSRKSCRTAPKRRTLSRGSKVLVPPLRQRLGPAAVGRQCR